MICGEASSFQLSVAEEHTGTCIGDHDHLEQNIREDYHVSSPMTKLEGFEFWRKTLKGATRIVAPMVDQSELAWRLLSRRHGAELCYTPMLNAKIFLNHRGYREREFQTHPADHPLIAQFCGHDPETIVAAARLVQSQVEAVDLNLGCPQNIARKGHYGSYLQEEWALIRNIISCMHRELTVPVTAKIRIFPNVERTIQYAQMIEAAGAQLLTIHGRLREQRGEKTGLADWDQIRAVREALSIPVFANGNILFADDIPRCLEATGAQGVMTAEGNLYNPAVFEDHYPLVWNMVEEYLTICREEAPASLTAARGHLFKLYRPCLGNFLEHRARLGEAKSFDQLSLVAEELNVLLRERYAASDECHRVPPLNNRTSGISSPEWFCRSYIRDRTLFFQTHEQVTEGDREANQSANDPIKASHQANQELLHNSGTENEPQAKIIKVSSGC